MSTEENEFPDTLTQRIGVLARRETEARVLAPVIEAMAEEFGREKVLEILRDTIIRVANEQGAELAGAMGGDGPAEFMDSAEILETGWRPGDRSPGPERRQVVVQHYRLQVRSDVQDTGHPRTGCNPVLQP